MNGSVGKSCFIKIILALAACLLAGFIIVIDIPNFIRAQYETAKNACINNLRQIAAAKNQWELENGKTNGIVTDADIKPYFMDGNFPKCPTGGTYIIGPVGEDPKCSIGTSVWPNDHVLDETNSWYTDFKAAYSKVFGLNHAQPSRK
jgi:hypothetical protein